MTPHPAGRHLGGGGSNQNDVFGAPMMVTRQTGTGRAYRRLFARLRSDFRSRSAIGSGGAQTHQTAAADRKYGARASAARSERHGATYLNAA